jgi:hypothetical protein
MNLRSAKYLLAFSVLVFYSDAYSPKQSSCRFTNEQTAGMNSQMAPMAAILLPNRSLRPTVPAAAQGI